MNGILINQNNYASIKLSPDNDGVYLSNLKTPNELVFVENCAILDLTEELIKYAKSVKSIGYVKK